MKYLKYLFLTLYSQSIFGFSITSTPSRVSISVELEKPIVQESIKEGEYFTVLSIPGAGHSPDIGRPNLPVIRKIIQIPEDAVPSLEIDVQEEQMMLKYPIIPVQPPIPKIEGATVEFTIDRDFYKIDRFFPEKWAVIKKIGYLRGHRVLFLEIYPVKYNPGGNHLKYAKSINLVIRLTGSNMQKTESVLRRYYSHPYEQTSRKMITNFRDFEVKPPPEIPIGYLIITADDYYSSILPLSEWKRKKGYFVTVTESSDIPGGATAANITSYIQDAYDDTLAIPPTFVLLVGDREDIPSHDAIQYPGITDLYYATTDGDDYIPDIYIGRFPVASAGQADTLVEKIIDYERNLWTQGTEWLNKAYFMAAGASAGEHQIEIETICNRCIAVARANGIECDSLYAAHGGTEIAWAINDGRVMAIYTGHGSTTGWEEPSFGQSDVRNLFNYDKYPFVVSHACLTGRFSEPECFGETWVRVIDKGASAFFGSVPSSWWGHDDTLQIGWFESMFGDSSTNFIGGFTQIGLYSHHSYASEDESQYYYEAYHIFGDPSLYIYTLVPKPITADHPSVIPTGDYSMEVSVSYEDSLVENALVCALADTQFVGYTNISGITTLNIKTTEPCTVWITVTGHNLEPYEGFALAEVSASVEIDPDTIQKSGMLIHPNPFSQITSIQYVVGSRQEKSPTSLKVYDLSGRLIETLVNKNKKPGCYSVTWGAKGFPSGIYFIKFKAGNYVSTKKAVILK